jgi:hypothetical protein
MVRGLSFICGYKKGKPPTSWPGAQKNRINRNLDQNTPGLSHLGLKRRTSDQAGHGARDVKGVRSHEWRFFNGESPLDRRMVHGLSGG